MTEINNKLSQTTIYRLLPIDSLQKGRYQPRIDFDDHSLAELAQSITAQGLIEPLVVREIASGCYEIIAGERRWRAARIAGLSEVPCMIGQYTDQQAAALTLIENIQRQELNLIEEASGYRRLCDEFNFRQEEIAVLVGKSRSHITNIMRLLGLMPEVQSLLRSGQLSFGHARLLVGLAQGQQLSLARQMIEQDWSVRQSEQEVKKLKTRTEQEPGAFKDRDVAQLEMKLSEQVGAPVEIVSEKGSGGWLKLKFFNNDTLAGLLDRMGLRYD
ncbi:partition protein ParB [Legionella birminghamensis]|uniref:Probable chromosome-partitioning protein ParB n=1 Tax=Legionella birminghamensis TaxID=28083 RepID=A0A378I628_9GAMM|nr:ParB/RepB/Spo0J family partition protein [Legionella birminghamensis]KTC72516.1 partition protein ParB [Legionella birminghamensis]STX30648.1 chromosome partitioning protein ParB [Legionella birminghamensis]